MLATFAISLWLNSKLDLLYLNTFALKSKLSLKNNQKFITVDRAIRVYYS